MGDHGSFVASRVVFGDLSAEDAAKLSPARCSFMDVVVALDHERINDKGVLAALGAVVATAPDVRVFNLSFSGLRPLGALDEVERRERLLLTQDLDNFIFARDVLVVVSAGNTPPGVLPATSYPDHVDDPAWALSAWGSGFNTLTCGSAVERLSSNGIVTNVGWPSPFTRVGPALPGACDAPIPEFGAHGGNGDATYSHQPHLGVWGFTSAGALEDRSGTSHAAPLLAREAALAIAELQRVCAPETRPYAATAKAYLALTAKPYPAPSGRIRELSRRTLGLGSASATRLASPAGDSAVLVWQGLLDGPDDIARVHVPIPLEWLKAAGAPIARIACAWDSPVHAALLNVWGCRRVSGRLRPAVDAEAFSGSQGQHTSHPLWIRTFDLSSDRLEAKDVHPRSDLWVLELDYAQIAEYYPAIQFSPKQRVGIAIELSDKKAQASPQPMLQSLPIAQSMVRLSASAIPILNPVTIRA